MSLEAAVAARHRPRRAVAAARRRRRHQRRLRGRARGRRARVRQDARRTRRPASTRPRRPALRWLAEPGGLGVPEVLGASDEAARARVARAGRGAATRRSSAAGWRGVHAAGADAFGGRRAATDRPARAAQRAAAGLAVVLRRAAAAAAARAGARSRLAVGGGRRAVEAVCDRIADLAGPPEPPARLHGDLWSGNVLWSGGRPYVIDPIAYGGHREVDLAMLRLFGSPGAALPRRLRGGRAARRRPRGARRALPAVPAARPRRAVRRRLRRLGRARRRGDTDRHGSRDRGAGGGGDGREPRHRRGDRGACSRPRARAWCASRAATGSTSRTRTPPSGSPSCAGAPVDILVNNAGTSSAKALDDAHRRRLERAVGAARDGVDAAHARVRARHGRARLGPDRQRLLVGGQAAVART